MVIEQFREGCTEKIYQRANDHGRMLPDGLEYIDSWVSINLDRCYQLMRCDDPSLLQEWLNKWEDLVEFDIVPVMNSDEAYRKILGKK